MNPELQKELLARLDALAAKLGVAAGDLWAVLLRQARIEAYTTIAESTLTLMVGASLFLLGWYFEKRYAADKYEDGWRFASIITLTASGVATIVAGINSFDLITLLGNPQYWALHQLIRR